VCITAGRGKLDRTKETGPCIYDVDAAGRIVGIGLCASKVRAPGDRKKAATPNEADASAAE
jgi:hypothetical protein